MNWLYKVLDDIIEDNTELHRSLRTTKFDEFEVVDLPLQQPHRLLQELLLNIVVCMLGLASQGRE